MRSERRRAEHAARDDLREGLRHAAGHLSELRSVFGSYKHIDRFRTEREVQPLHGRVVVRLYSPEASMDLAFVLGDVIYNIRSALDRLAWDLSRKTILVPSREVMFPIFDRLTDVRSFNSAVDGMPPAAIDEIRRLQPARLGTDFKRDPLWQLNELSNIAQHRTLAISGTEVETYLQPLGYTQRTLPDCIEYSWPIRVQGDVRVVPYSMGFLIGKPVEHSGDDLELTEEHLVEILRYVRDDVAPRFDQCFVSSANRLASTNSAAYSLTWEPVVRVGERRARPGVSRRATLEQRRVCRLRPRRAEGGAERDAGSSAP